MGRPLMNSLQAPARLEPAQVAVDEPVQIISSQIVKTCLFRLACVIEQLHHCVTLRNQKKLT